MAIQESDYMDFGNGIIGDDTFDVWRKKTNRVKVELDSVNSTLTAKINTDIANLSTVYIPQAGSATSVSTALQFTSPITFASNVLIGDSTLTSSSNKLNIDKEVDSSVQLTSTKVRAKTNLILGDKTYNVPSSPAINNAVLVAQTNGALSWQNVASIFELSGGLNQTTTVFEEVMPVGSVIPLAANPNDPNYLLCEGALVAKSAYPDLYEVLKNGTATCIYGETTNEFRLPNYSGRVVVGTGGTGVTFPSTFGATGGTETLSTSGHTLTAAQSGLPAHSHKFQSTVGGAMSLLGDTFAEGTSTNGNDYLSTSAIHDNTAEDADAPHSHNITAANRVQPYITVKWYIKAKKNTKIDFKIDIANSGLKSTTFGGQAQTLISPVNETIQLDVDPDNTSIALVNGKVAVKSSPTIPGSPIITGPDIRLYNETRRGTATGNNRRALVHGNGNGEGDPELNGYDRKVVTTIRDSGVGENNDTLIINYNDISPNSVGDYTGGVIINGTKAIMFEDGSILQSGGGSLRGNFKKATESESGKHSTVSPQYSDAFCYIDDEDDVVVGGDGKGVKRTGGGKSNGNTHRSKFMLPNGEKADKLYIGYYSMHVIAKSGKSYSTGYGYTAASTIPGISSRHSSDSYYEWVESFCESPNCKISKIVYSGDISSHSVAALDTQGYLWTHGVNQYGFFANGTVTGSYDETLAQVGPDTIIGKRESLANSETSTAGVPYNLSANRRYLPHISNPMLNSSGDITTDPSAATSLLKAIDATHVGSYNGSSHPDTIAMLGEDGRVYVAGYGDNGQTGDGTSLATNSNWRTVQTGSGAPLENITKLYSGGEDSNTYFIAIDENYDVWGWGQNGGGQLGTGDTSERARAFKIWDSSSKNRRANYVITNNAGSSDGDATMIIASHQTNAGVEIDKEFHISGLVSGNVVQQLTHTAFNTDSYSIQDLYFSNGNDKNFYYVLARNKTTNKLELWSSGYNADGQCGWQDPTNPTNYVNVSTNGLVAYRVNFDPDLLEKVVAIHPARQYNTGGNTHIHLSDGRIFSCGYLRWSFDRIGHSSQHSYKFTPIPMD